MSTALVTDLASHKKPSKTFLTFLILTEVAFLVPIMLEEYLLSWLILIGLAALAFMFYKPVNGLTLLPVFLIMPFEIPGLNAIQFSEIGTFLVLLSLIFAVLVTQEKLTFDVPALYPILAILAAAVLSVSNARYFDASIKNILKYIESFVLVLVLTVNLIRKKNTIMHVLMAILVAASLSSILGIGRFLAGYEKRVYGLVGGGFGAYTGIALLISVTILIFSPKNLLKWVSFAAMLLLTSALILSQTRAWLLATIAGLLFILLKVGNIRRMILFTLFFSIIFGSIYVMLSQNILDLEQGALVETATSRAFQTGFAADDSPGRFVSIVMRLFIWMHGFSIYMNYPIFGFGIGNLRFKNFFTGELGLPSDPDVGYVDNHWLNVLFETGILGLAGWIWFAVVVYKACRYLVRNSPDPDWQIISLSLSSAMIVFFVGGIFWALTVVHEMTVFIPLLVGLIFAARKIARHELSAIS